MLLVLVWTLSVGLTYWLTESSVGSVRIVSIPIAIGFMSCMSVVGGVFRALFHQQTTDTGKPERIATFTPAETAVSPQVTKPIQQLSCNDIQFYLRGMPNHALSLPVVSDDWFTFALTDSNEAQQFVHLHIENWRTCFGPDCLQVVPWKSDHSFNDFFVLFNEQPQAHRSRFEYIALHGVMVLKIHRTTYHWPWLVLFTREPEHVMQIVQLAPCDIPTNPLTTYHLNLISSPIMMNALTSSNLSQVISEGVNLRQYIDPPLDLPFPLFLALAWQYLQANCPHSDHPSNFSQPLLWVGLDQLFCGAFHVENPSNR